MTHFIIHKRTGGQFKIEVIVNYDFGGEFLTTDSTLIDDIKDWLNGNSLFMNYDSRAELEFSIREMAGIVSTTIGGVDFSEDINNLFKL